VQLTIPERISVSTFVSNFHYPLLFYDPPEYCPYEEDANFQLL
jgi:hypothetical protein